MSRIVVVGASGNLGTAILRALQDAPGVSSILGLARRPPVTDAEPYAHAEWSAVDVAEGDQVIDRLTDLFTGADAVIHLAWQLQPNTRRDQLREVNVSGTRRVAEAVGRAGVGQFLVASSWAAYSPDPDKRVRDESWPTGGVPSSHYSVDKAAQERVLDDFEAAHPSVQVARLRTALVFQRAAAAAVTRYFIGPFVPARLLRPHALPVLPLPRGLQVQVVHAADMASAYLAVLHAGARGAFNVAADPILDTATLSRLVGRGRSVPVPWVAIRPLLALGHRARLAAADEGWLDMARGLPMMDSGRIRALGWQPQYDAEETLNEMLQGLADSAGAPSPVLVGGVRSFGHVDRAAMAAATPQEPAPALPDHAGADEVPDHIDAGLLSLYLSDHLAGATAGRNRIRVMVSQYGSTRIGPDLARIAQQIEGERAFLADLVHTLGLHERNPRQALGAAAERVGRMKFNRSLMARSPMTPLLELELMRSAVIGKRSGWQVLATYAADLGLPEELFTDLAQRATEQARILEGLHEQVRTQALYTRGQHVA